ncbi:MAG: DUF2339 domain-containing protein [Myxococcota bacterium]
MIAWLAVVGFVAGLVALDAGFGGVVGAALGAGLGWLFDRERAAREALARAQAALVEQVGSLRGELERLGQAHDALLRRFQDGDRPEPQPAPGPGPVVASPAESPAPIAPGAPASASVASPSPFAASATIQASTPGPAAPPRSRDDDPFVLAFRFVRNLLFGGNTVVRVGILVLLVGVTLLLKYAADHALFPIELRMASAGLIGLLLVGVGLLQRAKRPGFARTLQGGGIAAMYLVVFFSFRTYALIPGPLAFALLAAIAASSAVLAVAQDAIVLVVIGQIGGFLAPILASTGQGSHVALFAYYLLLNLAIFGIALFRAWRPLNLIGFVFTFGIGTTWGVLRYRPEDFATTEPFLIAFFLLYVAIPVVFALRSSLRGWVDGSLVFGAPLAFLGLQIALVGDRPFAMAYTTLALAALYLGLARLLLHRAPVVLRTMIESFLAIGIGFGTLAVPYGLDNSGLTGATWAVEGAGLYFLGVRQTRRLGRIAAVALQILAGLAIVFSTLGGDPSEALPILNVRMLAIAFLAASSLFIARHAHAHRATVGPAESRWLQALIGWALLFLVPGVLDEIERLGAPTYQTALVVAFFGALSIGLDALGARFAWPFVRYPAAATTLFLLPLALVWDADEDVHLLAHGGALAWPIFLASVAGTLRRFVPVAPPWLGWLHPIALWGITGFVALAGLRLAVDVLGLGSSWGTGAILASIAAALAAVNVPSVQTRWPVAAQRAGYLGPGAGVLAAALLVASVVANLFEPGASDPLPHFPILNPLDLTQLAGFASVLVWQRDDARAGRGFVPKPLRSPLFGVVAAFAFVWWTAMLARAVHHQDGVPFDALSLWRSVSLQVAISITWSGIGLVVTVLASRRALRPAWIVGATLLGVVVVKLFLIDLARLSTLAKIGTFLVVGVLLLLVGYLAPVPPAEPEPDEPGRDGEHSDPPANAPEAKTAVAEEKPN